MQLKGQIWNFKAKHTNFKAKYANQKPNVELDFVITGQRILVQVSMGTENFVIFLSLADYSPSKGIYQLPSNIMKR